MRLGSINIPESEFQFDFVRSPGAGGQNVNKVNSKAVLRWNVLQSPSISEARRSRFIAMWNTKISQAGELVISSSRFRDQIRNKQDTLDKLTEMLDKILSPPKTRHKTKATRASKERRLKEKKQRSETKSRRNITKYL